MSCVGLDNDLLIDYALSEADDARSEEVRQHLLACESCSQQLESLQNVLQLESVAPSRLASLERLVPLFAAQARAQRPTWSWSMLWRRPALAAVSLALLALFFSVGYVQGNLVGRRTPAPHETVSVAATALPAPPKLGLLAQQLPASEWALRWKTGSLDSIRDASMPIDSL